MNRHGITSFQRIVFMKASNRNRDCLLKPSTSPRTAPIRHLLACSWTFHFRNFPCQVISCNLRSGPRACPAKFLSSLIVLIEFPRSLGGGNSRQTPFVYRIFRIAISSFQRGLAIPQQCHGVVHGTCIRRKGQASLSCIFLTEQGDSASVRLPLESTLQSQL